MELIVPFVLIIISMAYFRAAPKTQPLKVRLFVSAHGITALLIFLIAIAIGFNRSSDPEFGLPYLIAFLVPATSIIYSFVKFCGNPATHLLQLINIPAILLAMFIGFLAITGTYI